MHRLIDSLPEKPVRRMVSVLAVLGAAAFVVSGCQSAAQPGEGGDAAEESTTAENDSGADEGEASGSYGPECLLGTWRMPQDRLREYYESDAYGVDGMSVISAKGEWEVTFYNADLTHVVRGVEVIYNIDGTEVTVTMDGALSSTYTLTGDGIMATTIVSDDVETSATVAGIAFEFGDMLDDLTDIGGFSGYRCIDENTLMLEEAQPSGEIYAYTFDKVA